MYEEEKRSFPIRDFLLKLILIVIFVLLLVWLLPKTDLSNLTDRIFRENVTEMKEAAISYFTIERLPQKEGESVTLTLQQMLDKKLLLPFKDKNGKSCDVKNSYVKLTKMKDEYELKVYLKCSEEEDYIIVHLGCYSYCKEAICEKKEEPVVKKPIVPTPSKPSKPAKPVVKTGSPSCTLVITQGKQGTNGWYVGDVIVSFKTKTTTTKGAKITDFGIGTSKDYNKKTNYTVTKDGTTKVYGYVKDSKGKTAVCSVTVKKDQTKPDCSLAVLSGTKNNAGYISDVKVGFSSRVDNTSGINTYGVINSSKETYNSKTSYLVTQYGTTKVYGYVKDKAGNKAVCNLTVNKVKVEEEKYSEPSCSLEVKSGTLGNNNWYRSNVVVGFKTKQTTNGATVTNYGLGTSQNYDKATSYTISSDGTKVVYGYVKDSKGNTAVCSISVKKDATKPNCSLEVQSGTYQDGYYTSNVVIGFKSKNDVTSGMNSYGLGKSTTYSNNKTYTVSSNGDHTVYGYVKDNAGNTNVCNIKVTKKDKVYEYEYLKTWQDRYDEWSSWTTKTYDPSNPPKFESTPTKVVEDLGSKKVEDGYKYTTGAPIYGTVVKEVASYIERVCKGYTYYRTTTNQTTTYAVPVASNDGWVYQKTITKKEKPADTLSVKYVYAGSNWTACDNDCSSTPYKLYKVYTRTVGTVTVSDTVKLSTGVEVKCSEYETKTIYIYANRTAIVGYEEIRTMQYKTIYQYRYKTRTLLAKAGSSIRWSTKQNDTALISDGYKMTGNKREK